MSAISVRRLEPELHAWLQEQASRHGVSMEEEVRRVLRAAREAAETEEREARKARLEALFAKAIKPPPGTPNSTDVIRQMRDER